MKATIANFRSSVHTQKDSHMIILSEEVDSRQKALKMIGKKVVFKTQTAKEITGKIANAHGSKGAMRAVFERGLPGQALGKEVEII